MDFVPNAALLQAMFAQAAAPAFLLGGIAAFISVLMSRTTALMMQIRSLNELTDSDLRKGEAPFLLRRAVLLHRATYMALLSGIATTLLLLVMAVFTIIGAQHYYGAGLLFAVAVVLFALSLYNFTIEVRIALRELNHEARRSGSIPAL
jgi:hypothetical protein